MSQTIYMYAAKEWKKFPCQSANKKCDQSKTACICNGPIHSCLNFHDEDCRPDKVGAYKNTRSPTANSSRSEKTLLPLVSRHHGYIFQYILHFSFKWIESYIHKVCWFM